MDLKDIRAQLRERIMQWGKLAALARCHERTLRRVAIDETYRPNEKTRHSIAMALLELKPPTKSELAQPRGRGRPRSMARP